MRVFKVDRAEATCHRCGSTKPIADFARTSSRRIARNCKACHRLSHAKNTHNKREARRRAAETQGKRYDRGRVGAKTDPALPERRRLRQAAKDKRIADRASARAALIAKKPWLDRSLPEAERFRLRYALDPDFNLRQRLRAAFRRKRQGIKLGDLLRAALNRNGRSPTAEQFVGYSIATLRVHLERQFARGMDWKSFCVGDIHIDHIIPLASFDVTNVDELRSAWALPNLRPIWAEENIRKRDRRILLI